MATILCLAHYCDTHGPTPCMVTEGLPVPCSPCLEQRKEQERAQSGRRSLSSPEADVLETLRLSLQRDTDLPPPTMLPQRHSFSSPAVDTPPESPRLTALQVKRSGSHPRRDSSFRKTYDDNDRKRAVPCENCALTLPKKVQDQIPQDRSGSPSRQGQFDSAGPTLRTRKAYERLSRRSERSSPKSTPSDSDESEHDPSRSRGLKRTATCSSASSFSSSNSQSHRHYLDYTSTHDPISTISFSAIRASCLRTLSCETLPPNHATNSPTSPTSPLSWQPNRSFPTIPAPVASTSGGPIFFGDPQAGYTTAYIFRIPDPYARGRRRVYAFICLSKAHERTAMRAFSYLSAAFADLSSWIQTMAEVEADRLDAATTSAVALHPSLHAPDGSAPVSFAASSLSSYLPQRHSVPTLPHLSSSPSPPSPRATVPDALEGKGKRRSSAFSPPPPQLRTSAFLAGRPCDPDGFARRGPMGQIRSRGLAELVGQPDFFIQLHARFVKLLAQLALISASGSS